MMNLYHVTYASSDDSSGYLSEFVVTNSESEAENVVLNKYRGSGLERKDISALMVEVEGYAITITPKTTL